MYECTYVYHEMYWKQMDKPRTINFCTHMHVVKEVRRQIFIKTNRQRS